MNIEQARIDTIKVATSTEPTNHEEVKRLGFMLASLTRHGDRISYAEPITPGYVRYLADERHRREGTIGGRTVYRSQQAYRNLRASYPGSLNIMDMHTCYSPDEYAQVRAMIEELRPLHAYIPRDVSMDVWAAMHTKYYMKWRAADYISASKQMRDDLAGDIAQVNMLKYELSKRIYCGFYHAGTFLYIPHAQKFSLDITNTIHHPSEPAIIWEHEEVSMWKGHLIPNEWHKQLPSAQRIIQIPNMELRRCACEMLGWDKIIEELDCVEIDKDPDPQIGSLIQVEMPAHQPVHQWFMDVDGRRNPPTYPMRLLIVECGTGRTFALAVPPNMKTAREANAWTYGIKPEMLQPEIRT